MFQQNIDKLVEFNTFVTVNNNKKKIIRSLSIITIFIFIMFYYTIYYESILYSR